MTDRRGTVARALQWATASSRQRLAAALLLVLSSHVLAFGDPSVMLFGARLDDARSFAVETAASRGWHIRAVSASAAVFEQVLDGDEEEGILIAQRVLRIRATLTEDADGTRISLRAEEVELPGTEQEVWTDVTAPYADNLAKALSSLRAKWDDRRLGALPAPIGQPRMGTISPERSEEAPASLGDWAYAAERYAQSRGCVLTDRATELVSSGQGRETHRVSCEDGTRRLVQCRSGDCTAGD